jgi:signal transduction histidine kinase/ActR/RegA family two-component response regulator
VIPLPEVISMRLRTKILLSMAILTASLTAASLLVVRRSVDAHARHQILQSFQNSAVTLRDYLDRKDDVTSRTADLLAQTPVLKAVMTTRDPLTIQDTSETLWRTSGGDLLAIEDASGRLMALHAKGPAPGRESIDSRLRNAQAGEFEWWLMDGRLYRVAIRQLIAGGSDDATPLGTLAVGYEVNSSVAQETAHFVAADVAYRYQDGIVTSTLTPKVLAAMRVPQKQGELDEFSLSGERFLSSSIAISSSPDGPQLILLQSYDHVTQFVKQINRVMMIVGAVMIALGGMLVFLLSRSFTQPLDELMSGVRALSTGKFSFPLRVKGKDEFAELTSAFDRMRTNLQQSQDRLVNSARMEAVGQLAGGVAHDFNNLITVIKGYAELLMAQIKHDDPLMKYADQISKAGDRASSLTRQLLAFTRKQKAEKQPVDLNLLVTNLLKMLKVLVGEGFELVTATNPKLVKVLADPGQLEQVVLNLVVNARDAMASGGKIEISTEVAAVDESRAAKHGVVPGRFARLTVSDHGCGMDAATLEQIFQPFFTTKEVGKGTGLGLAIVYACVKQSDGFIEVESKVGEGSSFNIYVPELVAEIKIPELPKSSFESQCGSETILVVEDEQGVCNMVRDTLELRGYRVLLASSGEEALQTLQDAGAKIDLVLADVVMPKLGGLDLAIRINAFERCTRILLMSGYTDRINEIEKAGIPLLRKPFSPEKLALAIREVFQQETREVPSAVTHV